MMILTKEATDKDNNSDEKLNGERVWRIEGYFPDIRPKLNLEKKNIPENCLLYILTSLAFQLLRMAILLCIMIISFWGN